MLFLFVMISFFSSINFSDVLNLIVESMISCLLFNLGLVRFVLRLFKLFFFISRFDGNVSEKFKESKDGLSFLFGFWFKVKVLLLWFSLGIISISSFLFCSDFLNKDGFSFLFCSGFTKKGKSYEDLFTFLLLISFLNSGSLFKILFSSFKDLLL